MACRAINYFGTAWICTLACMICFQSTHASTFYHLKVPSKALPYCEFMPFDFIDHKIVKTELYNRITVTKPVKITFSRVGWDRQPITGLSVWSPNGRIKAHKISERKYEFQLPTLKDNRNYELRGVLKYPVNRGLQVCVQALGH